MWSHSHHPVLLEKQLPHVRKALNSPFPFSILSLLSSYSPSFPLSNPALCLLTRHLQRFLSQQSHGDPAHGCCPPACAGIADSSSTPWAQNSPDAVREKLNKTLWRGMIIKRNLPIVPGFIGEHTDVCCVLWRKSHARTVRLKLRQRESGKDVIPLLGSDQNQCSPHGKGQGTCRAQFTLSSTSARKI